MIPPLTPGQKEVTQNMVGWKNTFNMRQATLINLASTTLGMKNGAKICNQNHRRSFSITSPTKSLDLLRRNLQAAINKDIDNAIRKYIDKFFQPAIINIKNNLGQESVTEDHIRNVCKQILDEAKSMYITPSRDRQNLSYDSDLNDCDSESGNNGEVRLAPLQGSSSKRKETALEQPTVQPTPKKSKTKSPSSYYNDNMGCKFSLKRDGPKWRPERIKPDTLFIMGSRANKVLGYGQTRGRLYVRHPNLLRYCGDQEDKEWLQSQNLLPANGGKIYIMLLEDIKELTESDEYRNNPNLQLQELKGFEAPKFMNDKIKAFLEYIKREKKLMAVLDIDDNTNTPPPNVTITNDSAIPSATSAASQTQETTVWKTSQMRQQIDYPNMSSDMSSLSSSVISSILAGTYVPMNGNFKGSSNSEGKGNNN